MTAADPIPARVTADSARRAFMATSPLLSAWAGRDGCASTLVTVAPRPAADEPKTHATRIVRTPRVRPQDTRAILGNRACFVVPGASPVAARDEGGTSPMPRPLSKVAPDWWDYTTLDDELLEDAAKLTEKDILKL